MAYSPSIKILDHLNLVSSQSIYFWSRPMHFQLMSPGPTIDMCCDGEERSPALLIYNNGWLREGRQTTFSEINQVGPRGARTKASREVVEMGKGWPEGQAAWALGLSLSRPYFVILSSQVIPTMLGLLSLTDRRKVIKDDV